MQNKSSTPRYMPLVIGIFLIVSIIGTFTAIKNIYPQGGTEYTTMIAAAITAGAISFSVMFNVGKTDAADGQLEQLREERVEINRKIEQEQEPDIFHTIQLSLNELNQYYTINKAQATTSFRFSIAAIVAGLAIIITGIILNFTDSKAIEVTYIAGVSGILLEFIGGAYFFMYKKSLEQVNFFFGQLIKVQDTMLAINLADAIKEDGKKIDMQEKIIISLLERSLK